MQFHFKSREEVLNVVFERRELLIVNIVEAQCLCLVLLSVDLVILELRGRHHEHGLGTCPDKFDLLHHKFMQLVEIVSFLHHC